MGMYTELYFRGEVSEEAYGVIEKLRAVATTEINHDDVKWPDHPFFKMNRTFYLMNAGSYYFVPEATYHAFKDKHNWARPDGYVTIRTDIKNYESEIEAFFDWIMPNVKTTGFIGYSLYEEDREPTLYFKD